MTIDLLPGHGVRLPAPLPELRFGLTEAQARGLLAGHGESPAPDGVRNTFVCGCSWALCFLLPGLNVTLCADDDGRLRAVMFDRNPSDDRPACPVGYHGIDLLGWPAHELVEALRAEGVPVSDPAHGNLRHEGLHLRRAPDTRRRRPAPGRKPRHEEPFGFDHVSLHAPGALTRYAE
ncbi:hypothetical protein [Kitasatospora brasiliensis]|uniref:hypothetical protein n=1 Tax=Kitasatospora brasiliensis TaxID=3058040 RepID=UPI002931E96C|nr:hypothetical protein [Kitasatospora sp. K002]